MRKVLVVDDVAIIRDPIAASLRLAGFESFCAADGEEALTMTRLHRPDVILLDLSMPKMDGLTFLKHLRADPAVAHSRVILLTAMSEKKYVVAAMTLGVKDYLLKSRFRLTDLLERITKIDSVQPPISATSATNKPLAPSVVAAAVTPHGPPDSARVLPSDSGDGKIPCLLTREQFVARIKDVFKAKTLSGVVAQVIALASSPRGEMTQLAGLIAQDPMLSVRVLQAANSAAYSTGVTVTTIPNAIRKLGFTTIRNVAAALGVFDCMPETAADGFDPIRYWQHSFAVAQLCERLATTAVPEQSGLAYVIGLCHDLGDIFIRTQFGNEYRQVVETAKQTGRPRDELYTLMLGMTEAQMLGEVLKSISLPPAIREPIEILHSTKRRNTTNQLAKLLSVAENFANAAMLASNPKSEIEVLTLQQCKAATGVNNLPAPDPTTLRTQVIALTITLARLSRSDEAKLLIPMFAASPTKIWITQAPGVANSDPVSLALASLAEVTVQKRLPEPKELEEFHGLVVVSPSTNTPGFSAQDIDAAIAKTAKVGRTLSVLSISSAPISESEALCAPRWREAISLSELACFASELSKVPEIQAAA